MSHQSELIGKDIHAYLAQHEKKGLLRLLTCGSVDDGKSTLIGRLLHDSQLIYEDQLSAITAASAKTSGNQAEIDLSLLVDGLQAEREQGITIDVAYRYFSTARRKFIIADTPGHEQYTRNMATGASNCDLAIILIDARNGVKAQTRRHSLIALLLGIKHIIIAINKMDLIDYDQTTYEKIKNDYIDFTDKQGAPDLHFIPISALKGDNVVNSSEHMAWYDAPALIEILETLEIANDQNLTDVRLPVQYVNRAVHGQRNYCGSLAAGVLRQRDKVTVLPSGRSNTVAAISIGEKTLDVAYPPMAIAVQLQDELDISRGDIIVGGQHQPRIDAICNANIVWMNDQPMQIGKQYLLKTATRTITGAVTRIQYGIDVNTLEHHATDTLKLNEIGNCNLEADVPIIFDAYPFCKTTGAFILIDRLSNATVGAGMITNSQVTDEKGPVTEAERKQRYGQRGITVWLAGRYSRKIAQQLERRLFNRGKLCVVLNDDEVATPQTLVALNNAGFICLCQTSRLPETDNENTIRQDCDETPFTDILANIHAKSRTS